MSGSLRAAVIAVVWCGLGACSDEGASLGEEIGAAATRLGRSSDSTLILSYSPRQGVDQQYSIGIGKSVLCPTPPCNENIGGLTVSVERGQHGSTTYHMRFVAVPNALEIHKNGQPTQIVLRKINGIVTLVELR